jgi:hypothetical protein
MSRVKIAKARFGALLGFALLAGGGSVEAGLVTSLTRFEPAGVPTVKISYKDSPTAANYQSLNVYAGPSLTTIWDGGTIVRDDVASYCVDLLVHLVQQSMPAEMQDVSGMVLTSIGGGPFDRNIGAAGWQLANINPGDAHARGALQVAIWEAVYDFDGTKSGSTNLASGYFKLSSGGDLFNLSASYLDLLRDQSTSSYRTAPVTFLNYGAPLSTAKNQDQIIPYVPPLTPDVVPVPEPSSLALAAAGVLGFGVVRLGAWYRRARR